MEQELTWLEIRNKKRKEKKRKGKGDSTWNNGEENREEGIKRREEKGETCMKQNKTEKEIQYNPSIPAFPFNQS